MNLKPLLIALAVLGAIALLALAGGIGGLAAGLLFAVVAGYLLYRREPAGSHERFFGEPGEETEMAEPSRVPGAREDGRQR